MIRIATEEDLELVLKFGLKFAETTIFKDKINEEKLKYLILDFVNKDNPNKIILLYEDKGMLAGIANIFLMGLTPIATEVAWWVEPEHRKSNIGKELIELFEIWAKLIGCHSVVLSSLDDNLGKFYEKIGYSLCERTYIKDL